MQGTLCAPHTMMMDAATLNSLSFPVPSVFLSPAGTQGAQYYIVVDSLTYGLTASTAGDYSASIIGEGGGILATLAKTLAAGEVDFLHMSFPRGLIVAKLMYAPASGQTAGSRTNAIYSGDASVTSSGLTPTSGTVTVTYRHVAPADLGW